MPEAQTQPSRLNLHTIVRTHLWFATAGFCAGLVGALALVQFGPAFTRASPFLTTLSLVLVSTIAGAMTAGLVSLTPLGDRLLRGGDSR